jgi:hypothetical protein
MISKLAPRGANLLDHSVHVTSFPQNPTILHQRRAADRSCLPFHALPNEKHTNPPKMELTHQRRRMNYIWQATDSTCVFPFVRSVGRETDRE